MHRPPPDAQRWSLRVDPQWSLQAWRDAAREALLRGVAPPQLDWLEGSETSLLDAPAVQRAPMLADASAPNVPRDFLELAATCLCHHDPQRLALLYRLLWRIVHGERSVLSNPADADVLRATALAQAVRRDTHKMKAFVRFREVPGQPDAFIAWFEPQHHIVDRVAPFFARRFTGMRWAILTPSRSVAWEGACLRPRRTARGCPGRGCARITVADLLRQHLQSGATQYTDDDAGDAGKVLAPPAGGPAAATPGARCGRPRAGNA